MLLEKDKSCLLLVDVQEKLTPFVLESDKLIAQCHWLMRLAETLEVPIAISEQYTRGLGHTVEPLGSLTAVRACDKVHFSCYRDPAFLNYWQSLGKQQAVIIGIETHVCVLQTALDMHQSGIEVFVVVDAVSSRKVLDHRYALKRMKQKGISLITSEMVFFEWVGRAGTPLFKTLSQTFLRN